MAVRMVLGTALRMVLGTVLGGCPLPGRRSTRPCHHGAACWGTATTRQPRCSDVRYRSGRTTAACCSWCRWQWSHWLFPAVTLNRRKPQRLCRVLNSVRLICECVCCDQSVDCHVVGNHVVGNEQVAPWLPGVSTLVHRRVAAPASRCACLGKHGGIL